MAGRNEVRTDLIATGADKAAKEIDKVADAAERLEDVDPTVEVGADTGDAKAEIDAVADAAGELTRKDHLIALKAQGDAARAELKALTDQLEGVTDAARRADSALADVDGTGAAAGVGDFAGQGERAKSAYANLGGNVAGELGQIAGGAGVAAQAVGELTEAAFEGELKLGDLAKVAGPMAGLAAAMTVMQGVMEATAASKAFDAARIKDYTEALEEGVDPVDAFIRKARELSRIDFRDTSGGGPFGLFSSTKDLIPILDRAELKLGDFVGMIEHFGDMTRGEWVESLRAQGVATEDAMDIVKAASAEYGAWGNTIDGVAASERVLADDTAHTASEMNVARQALDRIVGAFDDAHDAANDAAFAQRDAAFAAGDLRRAVEKTDSALDELKGALDMEDAIAGFQSSIAEALDLSDDVGPTQEQIRAVKRSIIELGETAGANPAVIKAQVESVTADNLMKVAGDVTAFYSKYPATMQVTPSVNWGRLKLPAGYAPGNVNFPVPSMVAPGDGGGAPAPVVNVTQHIPRGWRGDALTSARQAARRSGGLYQRARR